MKKHNVRTTPTEQQRKLVAKARRARRKARLAALLRTTLRGLMLENDRLRQQLKQAEIFPVQQTAPTPEVANEG